MSKTLIPTKSPIEHINEKFPNLIASIDSNREVIAEIGRSNMKHQANVEYGQLETDRQLAYNNGAYKVWYSPGRQIEPNVVLDLAENGDFKLKAIDANNPKVQTVIASRENGECTFNEGSYKANINVIDYSKINGESFTREIQAELMASRMQSVTKAFDHLAVKTSSQPWMEGDKFCAFTCKADDRAYSCIIKSNSEMTVYEHAADYDFMNYYKNSEHGVKHPDEPSVVYKRGAGGNVVSSRVPLLTGLSGGDMGKFNMHDFRGALKNSSNVYNISDFQQSTRTMYSAGPKNDIVKDVIQKGTFEDDVLDCNVDFTWNK